MPVPSHAGEADHTTPETGMVWLLNDVRSHPGQYAVEWGIPELADIGATPPLAYNRSLAASAQARSNEMSQHRYFGHRSPVTGKMPNRVARDHGYALPSWYPNNKNNIETLHAGSGDIEAVLCSLLRSQSHRDHLLGLGGFSTHSEIGVGYAPSGNYWTIHTAHTGAGTTFATGVAYADNDRSGGFDPGEGLPGVTVEANGTHTTTNSAGGWSLPLPSGRYTITIHGAGFIDVNRTRVKLANTNITLDAASGTSTGTLTDFRRCGGKRPTIVGTNQDDDIVGTSGDDVIWAGKGNDSVWGGVGDDTICGGPGNDTITGNRGADHLKGNSGDDFISGGPGDDFIDPGSGTDTVRD